MSLRINARFKSSGIPSTGLSPTVTVYNRSDNSTPVTAQVMTEVGNGFYEYIFKAFFIDKDYLFAFDGTATLPTGDRYLEANWNGIADLLASINGTVGGGGGSVKLLPEDFEKLKKTMIEALEKIEVESPEIDEKALRAVIREGVIEIESAAKVVMERMSKGIATMSSRIDKVDAINATVPEEMMLQIIKEVERNVKPQTIEIKNSLELDERKVEMTHDLEPTKAMMMEVLNEYSDFLKNKLK